LRRKRFLTRPPAVEFLALKSKSTVVPGDAHDVAALHAALDSKDKYGSVTSVTAAAAVSGASRSAKV
jgi:hypothetical protein